MEKISTETLKRISIEKNIPFSNLLGAAALEDTVKHISESGYSGYLWLQNGKQLNEEQYRKKLNLTLEYDYVVQKPDKQKGIYPGEGFTKEHAEIFLKEILAPVRDKVFDWNGNIQSVRHYTQIGLDASMEGMQVPVTLKIYPLLEEKITPRKEEMNLLLWKDKKAVYYNFPAESLLVEKFIEIAVKLELIQSLKNYYDIYCILERESIDGRKVKGYIEEMCSDFRIAKDRKRMSTILGYKNYTYMKKRWKKFLRSIHAEYPTWEEVMERLEKFYLPIWEAVVSDEIFFGDWMPELKRYLG